MVISGKEGSWSHGLGEDGYETKWTVLNIALFVGLQRVENSWQNRTLRLGITQDSDCMLCGGKAKSSEHIFFECTFSRLCLEDVFKWLGMNIKNT